jgi:serine protease Do
MKRFIATIVIVSLAVIWCAGAFASGAISIRVDGRALSTDARIINGKVYVPLNDIAGSLGASASWNSNTSTATVVTSESEVTNVISKLSPSVVGIIGKLKESSDDYSSYSDNLIFGSGVIYKANGYIVTNAHVVEDMESIVVVLSTGRSYNARLKAIDTVSDLALIKIDKGMLTPAVLGNASDIEEGKRVVAIGTPLSFSLRNSASEGIISGLNRSADGAYRFIQSDAAINGGNSGGPLVDMKGRVIGINTVKYVGYGVEGLSFSIPVDTVKYVLGHFEKYGKVRRPYLGAEFMEGIAARYGLPSNEGLTISEIEKDSPAEAAGLQQNDILKAVGDVEVTTVIDYNEEMKNYLPGDRAELTILRNNTAIKVSITFEEVK